MSGHGGSPSGPRLGYLDVFSQAALVADEDGRVVEVNDAALRLLGWSADLLVARPVSALCSQDDQAAFREVAGQVLTGLSWRGVLDAVPPDDSTVRLDVACAALRRDGGVIAGMVCAMSAGSDNFRSGSSTNP